MARIPATPAVPYSTRFDPEKSIIENARDARARARESSRASGERLATQLARRIFHVDEVEFTYDAKIGLDVPMFEIEGELIAYGAGEFSLIEWCSECGSDANGRTFSTLSEFGAALETRDESEAYVCRNCQMFATLKGRK